MSKDEVVHTFKTNKKTGKIYLNLAGDCTCEIQLNGKAIGEIKLERGELYLAKAR